MSEAFWSWQLGGALVLNAIVQAIAVGAYAARAAGVITKRVAISISLFSLFATASRLANLAYAPLISSISDRAGNAVSAAITTGKAALAAPVVGVYEWQLRAIILAGTIGTLIGAALLPTFEYVFQRGISSFERLDSVPRALFRVTDPRVIAGIARSLRFPRPAEWRAYRLDHVPAKLLIANLVLQAVYAIGVVSSLYASVREPALARTALSLSGIINGIGTIAFALFVDPTAAAIVDQAVHGRRSVEEVRSMVFWLTVTFVLGTLASQLVLVPAALLIEFVARLYHH